MTQQKQPNQIDPADASGKRASLDRQYGNIGISAVAAALPYVGKTKIAPAQGGSENRPDGRKRSVLAI